MASLSEMLQYAQFKQSQASGVDTMQRVSDLVKSVTDISKQRKEKERHQRLTDYIRRGMEAGELEAEYKISPGGEITQGYKSKQKDKTAQKAVDHYKNLAAKEGWQFNIDESMPVKNQLQTARQLYATKKAEAKKLRFDKQIWQKSGLTILQRNKILGTLKTGKYTNPMTGSSIPLTLKNQEQAINFLQQQGYQNYIDDPEIMEIINKLPSTNKPIVNNQPTSRYKAGETRVVEGVTYKRNETGQWLPQ